MNEELDWIAASVKRAKGKRPDYFDDPATDRLMSIALALTAEVSVLRQRLDTIERLLEKGGLLSRADIEAYRPDDEAAAERQLWHARYAARILRIVQQELDAVAKPDNNVPMHRIADEINEM